MTDTDESLRTMLARSGTAPDYTMRVLQNETGIPPETLRSWENRHGFPSPARTPGNQRRYTERDLVAIRWLLEQTKHGRGISNAIEILKRHLPDPPPVTPNTSPAKPVESPLSRLTGALRQGDLAAAQTRWDDLVLGLSPLAIGDALLRLHLTSGLDERARAFLLRKATVLLDDAGPDTGDSLVAIITPDASGALLPATVAAAALARSGQRVLTPFPVITSLTGIGAIRASGAREAVLIDIVDRDADSFRAILPEIRILHWRPSTDPLDTLVRHFSASLG